MFRKYFELNKMIAIIVLWMIFIFIVIFHSIKNKAVIVNKSNKGSTSMILQYAFLFFLISFCAINALISNMERICILEIIGTIISVFGFFLYCYTLFIIKKSYNPLVGIKENQKLIKTGPYKFIRHPLYSFQFIMIAGTIVCLQHWGFLFIPIVLYFYYRTAKFEEEILKLYFPEYTEYIETTKMFVPFIL